jgi:hypothetical protein
MKRIFNKLLLLSTLLLAAPLPATAFENLSSALNPEQQACFSTAMIGMDSVINARLGVPAEHALDLASVPVSHNSGPYDVHMLKVILNAYLWHGTPHSYAINVFYDCAVKSSYQKQARVSQ